VLILREELGSRFAKAVFARLTEEVHVAGLGHASRQQRLGLDAVTGTGALTDSLAVDDLVDVPNAPTQEKSRRSSTGRCHDGPRSALLGSDDRIVWNAGKTLIFIAKGLICGWVWPFPNWPATYS
jgi:hypothetical protein